MILLLPLELLANPITGGDTLVVEKPNKVTIITTDSLQHILVEGEKDDPNYAYSNTLQIVDSNYVGSSSINKGDFTIGFGRPRLFQPNTSGKPSSYELNIHWCMGFSNGPGMPKPADLSMGNSAELWFFFDYEWRPWRNNHIFSFGLGFDWRNYRMEGQYIFKKDQEDMNIIERLPEGTSPKFSRIKVYSLNFPIRYQYQARNFGFSLGPILNFNTYASIKTKYKLDGNKTKEMAKNIHPTPITVDFMGTISTPIMDFYVKYSPCNVLQSDYGLKFKSLSIGFMF